MKHLACLLLLVFASAALPADRRPVPRDHPRLFGTAERLRELARTRPDAWRRMLGVALEREGTDHQQIVSSALVYAVTGDAGIGRQALDLALKYVDGPVRTGHQTFGHDLARAAIAYDLCWPLWSPDQRRRFHDWLNRTYDANRGSETHVFHNGWYGYKWWGIGLAAYASYHENDRAPAMLAALEREYRERVVPGFKLAGDGGGWAEGYYVNYFLYEWLLFCDVALRLEGIDYFAMSPEFLGQRAVAGMFEAFPGIREFGSRRPVPIGDSGGRVFTPERDKALSARRILVNRFRPDPAHHAVHAFNETTPVSAAGANAYKDFLWRDPSIPRGNLAAFKLSHLSRGPGYLYARSSWDEDATHFFFKCGDRFTAHQHLDLGHFAIYKDQELLGDGGHFYAFDTDHEVNYTARTIAHNTILVKDPAETWPPIRKGKVSSNDGGQHHDFPHHNGAVEDAAAWERDRRLYDLGDILAFEDRGPYLYVAADATRAYSPKKLAGFTRQIVYIRPGTFVIFDRVESRSPSFKKTFVLQAMKPPAAAGEDLTVTNGDGRVFIQTVLSARPEVKQACGPDLYRIDGRDYPPLHETGAAPECRIEISPRQAAATDWFLHVVTATGAGIESVPRASGAVTGDRIVLRLAGAEIAWNRDGLGGEIAIAGRRAPLARKIVE